MLLQVARLYSFTKSNERVLQLGKIVLNSKYSLKEIDFKICQYKLTSCSITFNTMSIFLKGTSLFRF